MIFHPLPNNDVLRLDLTQKNPKTYTKVYGCNMVCEKFKVELLHDIELIF